MSTRALPLEFCFTRHVCSFGFPLRCCITDCNPPVYKSYTDKEWRRRSGEDSIELTDWEDQICPAIKRQFEEWELKRSSWQCVPTWQWIDRLPKTIIVVIKLKKIKTMCHICFGCYTKRSFKTMYLIQISDWMFLKNWGHTAVCKCVKSVQSMKNKIILSFWLNLRSNVYKPSRKWWDETDWSHTGDWQLRQDIAFLVLTVSPRWPGCPGSPSFPGGPCLKKKKSKYTITW